MRQRAEIQLREHRLNRPIASVLAAGLVACGGTSFEPLTHELASEAAWSGVYRFRYGFSRLAGDSYVSDAQVSNSFPVTP